MSVLHWTLAEVAGAVAGSLTGDATATIDGVVTDSRLSASGKLFIAVAGERFDGHDFVAAALAAGAVAAMVEQGRGGGASSVVEVADTVSALRDLAAYRRNELTVPVVAVTGSTGKTSTKDILRSVLAGSWASPASFNNEIGLPLTILGTPADATAVVAEVGSRGTGHIAWLAPAVRPHVAIITNLGVVHMETFGSPEKLAAAKWELIEALEPGGTAVLPLGETRFPVYRSGPTVTFGDDASADVSYRDISLDDAARPTFTLSLDGQDHRVSMSMAGGHQPANAAAAAAAAIAVGRPVAEILSGLETATGSPGRMEIHRGPVTVVNDAYNANPDSVEAALRSVASLEGRHVAVLGEMAELGPERDREHARIGRLARELDFAAVVVVGQDHGIAEAAGAIARAVGDEAEALAVLSRYVREGDIVLVKASNVVGLQDLAHKLMQEVSA